MLPSYVKLDKTVRPQDDFFGHACNTWIKANPIPDGLSEFGIIDAVRDKTFRCVKRIIDDCLSSQAADCKQLATFYKALLFQEKHLARSLDTLRVIIKEIQDFPISSGGWAGLLGLATRYGIWAFMDMRIIWRENHWQLAVYLSELPFSKVNDYEHFREDYLLFLSKQKEILDLHGLACRQDTELILRIERDLASFRKSKLDTADARQYHKFTWAELNQAFGQFDWPAYFKGVILRPRDLLITQVDEMKRSLSYFNELTEDELKQYLVHLLIMKYNYNLSTNLEESYFKLFDPIYYRWWQAKTPKGRLYCRINNDFSDTIGRIYVKKHFDPANRALTEGLNDTIVKVFNDRLRANRWLSPHSRQAAQAKLAKIVFTIGYSPEAWRDYSTIELVEDNPVENAKRIYQAFSSECRLLLEEKNNFYDVKHYWHQDAQSVYAWTDHRPMTVSYMAGYLQLPYCDHKASLAYNLGTIGSTIGHEISHHFDTCGMEINHKGESKAIFSKNEQAVYEKMSTELVAGAAKRHLVPAKPLMQQHIKQELVADLTGLQIALAAAKTYYEPGSRAYNQALKAVFIGYAQTHAYNYKDKTSSVNEANTHPRAELRVNGIVSHCDAFYDAFDIKLSDKLYIKPADRIKIW